MQMTENKGLAFQQRVAQPFTIWNKKDGGAGPGLLAKGGIVKATLLAVRDNMAELVTDRNMRFLARAEHIQGKPGDTLLFEVMQNDGKGVSLKQIQRQAEEMTRQLSKQVSQEELMEMMKQHNMAAGEENMLNPKEQAKAMEEQRKISAAKAKIQRELTYAADNISQSAINELIANGLSLEKISLSVLNTVMREIESKPEQMPEPKLDALIEHAAEEEIHQQEQLSKLLRKQDMSVNDKNIQRLEGTLHKMKEIQLLDDDTIARLIGDEKPLTLDRVYMEKFSSASSAKPHHESLPADIWQALSQQVDGVLDREGMDKNEPNLAAAKFLLENDLPLTKENIEKADFLNNIADRLDEKQALEDATALMKQGKGPGGIELVLEGRLSPKQLQANMAGYEELMKALPEIETQQIHVLLKKQIPLTIANLRQAAHTPHLEADPDGLNPVFPADGSTIEEQAATARRQLAEIQLKLTREAALRLARQNIMIDTMPLEKALAQLRAIENQAYAKNLKIMGAEVTTENLDGMGNVFDKLKDFRVLTNNVFGDIIRQKKNFTIHHVSASIRTAQSRILEELDKYATVVSPKYGDSFGLVKKQLAPFLEGLGISPSDENIRAASILSRNEMDVTEESILQIRNMDSKLTRIQATLHPNIAASMLKDGLNPAEMHVDDVLAYIDRFQGRYGDDINDKLARYIMELDESEAIGPDMRKAMTAIYRMLHIVRKDDAVALGVTAKNGIEATLGNLLEAADYYRSTRGRMNEVDIRIDESTGGLAGVNVPEGNIRGLLDKLAFNKENIRAFTENAAPDHLARLMEDNADIKQQAMADLARDIQRIAQEQNTAIQNMGQMKADELVTLITNTSPQLVHWLHENKAPLTFNNIAAARTLMERPFFIGEAMDSLPDSHKAALAEAIETGASLQALSEGIPPETILARLEGTLDDILRMDSDSQAIRTIGQLRNILGLQEIMARRPGHNSLQLPLRLNDKIAGLHLYVVNENWETASEKRIYMSLDTANLGNLQIYVTQEGGRAALRIASDNKEGVEFLRQNSQILRQALAEEGVNDVQLFFEADAGPVANPVAETLEPLEPEARQKFLSKFEIIV